MIILSSKIRSAVGWIVLSFIVLTCSPNPYDEPIPYAPFPDIVLNLNLPENIALKTTGATLAIGGGVRGIIVHCRKANDYAAYERNCSYHPNDACATVNIDPSNLFLIDSCCGSTFDLATGTPTGGVAIRPLAQYKTSYDGAVLIITDERID